MDMTLEYFSHYKTFAENTFKYLNGKINKFCTKIHFEVDFADMVNYTYANLRRPNNLYLHIYNIIAECNGVFNRNKIYSMIFIVIGHELHHVDQMMSQESYKNNKVYREEVETDTDFTNYMWLKANKKDIDQTFGIDLDLSYYSDLNLMSQSGVFTCRNVADYYRSIFKNVIFRNDKTYEEFESNILLKYPSLLVSFDNTNNLLIKNRNEFCGPNLNVFIQLVNDEAAKYDHYTLNVSLSDFPYREILDAKIIAFSLSDRYSNPIVFPNR